MEKHELIQVKIELGHKAWCRKQPTLEGFTHEWVMFVRGPDNSDVSHFVEKVVFFLHDSFPRPKRVVKDPPFKLEEKGYGCFHLPVQVHFKNKEEPKKVDFDYDLLLPGLGQPPVSNIRSEALTFKNPTDEFKRKVLRAGGVIISNANGCPSSTTINGSGSHLSSTCKTSKKSLPASNSPTGNRSEKTPAKKVKLDKPIKSKLSSESSSSASASVSSKRPADPDSVVTPVTKKKKSSSESLLKCKSVGFMSDGSVKDKKDDHKESMKQKLKALAGKGNVEKTEKGEKKKEKKISLESSSSTKRRDSTSAKKEKREKLLNSSPMEHKPVKSETKLPTKEGLKSVPVSELKTPKKEEKLAKSTPKISKSVGKLEKKDYISGESKSHSKLHHKSKHVKKEGKKVEKLTIRRNSNESWTSSASSSSSLFSVGTSANANKNNALGTLLAELGDEDDGDEDDEIDVTTYSQSEAIKPTQLLQSNSGKFINSNNSTNNNIVKNSENGNLSNLQNGKHESSLNKQNKSKSTEKQEADKSHLQKSSHKAKSESEKHSNNSAKGSAKSLLALHKKLVHLKDSSSLQKVVDILETTGSFSITETSLKFDLCTLDAETVRKIENCVNR